MGSESTEWRLIAIGSFAYKARTVPQLTGVRTGSIEEQRGHRGQLIGLVRVLFTCDISLLNRL